MPGSAFPFLASGWAPGRTVVVDRDMNSHAGHSTSVWMQTATLPDFPPLKADERADVCIVGAGISGLTTAYFCAKAGKSVVVLDDGPIVSGETERTTAHLVTALDDRFYELERLHGAEGARLAAESHAAAIDAVERIVLEERIACEFARLDGYLFPGPGEDPSELDTEYEAARRAGIKGLEKVAQLPIPSLYAGPALRFARQAQFHPLRYLAALAAAAQRLGARIYARTHAAKIHGGNSAAIETTGGPTIRCDAVVMATNTPVNDRLVIHTKQAAYRTFVVGLEVPAGSVPRALYWDTADPYHYIRLQSSGSSGTEVLIVGGEDHKTGQADDQESRWRHLEQWTRSRFPTAGALRYKWSGQVMEPVDALAFIGRNPLDHDNVFVATGDSGNGMTHGTIAGLLLTDLIRGVENPWAHLYDPRRRTARSAGQYLRENMNMARQYVDWLTAGDLEKDQLIPPGTGAVVRAGLRKIAVYRDAAGRFHECSAVCPHLGAIVSWNDAEETWDCPAHGSRFDCYGHVLNGPANADMHAVETRARESARSERRK